MAVEKLKLQTCRRCGWLIRDGTYHYPYSKTSADRVRKKFQKGACDIFRKGEDVTMAPIGSAFGVKYKGDFG